MSILSNGLGVIRKRHNSRIPRGSLAIACEDGKGTGIGSMDTLFSKRSQPCISIVSMEPRPDPLPS